ncbi:RHS repeat-associated core domain-containing protein [Sorangium sp. So ce1389]|uniref:RHS repeat-associated core domain-containing protein n=1 Tax=Sorangium sp. So ce1389 TaxID=3133336 RepID=UPI003F606B4F
MVNSATGAVAQRMDFDEFGRVLVDTSPGFTPFGFAGGLYDRDTGLVRFGARDYDPETGRWTSKDPILFWAGDANVYAYVGNDPINRNDPSGLLEGVPGWLEDLDNSGWLRAAGDFSAGVSGALTLGLSDLLIEATGLDEFGSKCSTARWAGEIAGTALGLAAGGQVAATGREFTIGKNFRIAPFGNRAGHKIGRWPHYHRRGSVNPRTGQPGRGQGIGRHRPWETKADDKSWWSRF